MNVTPDTVAIEVEFSHPTYLWILNYLSRDHYAGDERDVGEWLKTLARVQMQREIDRFEIPALGKLPEDVRTNILLHQQHRDQGGHETSIEDSINEFVNISFEDLIDQNDLESDG